MSGTTDRERTPTTDAEWARDTDRRLDEAEQPEATRAGEWTLSTQDGTGNLMACHEDGGCVLVAEKPPSDADPDGLHEVPPEQIPEHKAPRIKVKGGIKTLANVTSTVYNVWNTTADFEEAVGQWTHDATNITIPEDGDYDVMVFMPWASNATGARALDLRKNGTLIDQDKRAAPSSWEVYTRIVNTFRFVRGDVLSIAVWQDSGANLNCGGANFGDAWAMLVIKKIADADIIAHDAGTL